MGGSRRLLADCARNHFKNFRTPVLTGQSYIRKIHLAFDRLAVGAKFLKWLRAQSAEKGGAIPAIAVTATTRTTLRRS